MAEFWFDTIEGKLVVGEAAFEQRVQQSGIGDIVPLAELATNITLPVSHDEYDKAIVNSWTIEDYKHYGKWVLNLIRKEDEQPPVTLTVLRNLFLLGFGPQEHRIISRFDNKVQEYKKAIGSPFGTSVALFDHLSSAELLNYVESMARRIGRRPTEEDIEEAANHGYNPGAKFLRRRFGTLSRLYDLLGYPDVRSWEKDDIIYWGVDVIRANPSLPFNSTLINILHNKGRGPSLNYIYTRFPSLKSYLQQVKEQAALIIDDEQELLETKLTAYRTAILEGKLPEAFIGLADEALLKKVAKYMLFQALTPQATRQQLVRASGLSIKRLIDEILRGNEGFTAGNIEIVADRLGIFDDIWPSKVKLENFQVSDEEVREAQQANRERLRRSRLKPSNGRC